jgi:hypothetical protein
MHPVFTPYAHTLAYSDHLLGIAALTAPLQWLTANPVLVYNLAFIASYANAASACTLLARVVTDRRDAAAVAAVIYACSAFRVAHFAHLQWLMTGWLPLSLWALHRYFATGVLALSARERILLCDAVPHRQLLCVLWHGAARCRGHGPRYGAAPAANAHGRPCDRRRGARRSGARADREALYYRVRQENNFRRTSDEIERLSADVSDYFPRTQSNLALAAGASRHWRARTFPGAVALALCRCRALDPARPGHTACRTVRGDRRYRFVLSLGPHPTAWGHRAAIAGPYRLLLDIVPGLDGLRAVSRMGLLVILALAVLAAQGAVVLLDSHRIRSDVGGRAPRRADRH